MPALLWQCQLVATLSLSFLQFYCLFTSCFSVLLYFGALPPSLPSFYFFGLLYHFNVHNNNNTHKHTQHPLWGFSFVVAVELRSALGPLNWPWPERVGAAGKDEGGGRTVFAAQTPKNFHKHIIEKVSSVFFF